MTSMQLELKQERKKVFDLQAALKEAQLMAS